MKNEPFHSNVWYTVRVSIVPIGGGDNEIKVYLDGVELISETDDSHSAGTVGLRHYEESTIECDDAEVMGLPVEDDRVGINNPGVKLPEE